MLGKMWCLIVKSSFPGGSLILILLQDDTQVSTDKLTDRLKFCSFIFYVSQWAESSGCKPLRKAIYPGNRFGE